MQFTLVFQKGQMIKNGMKGKEIKHNPARDAYAQLSYDTAHKTAARLDNVLKEVSLSNSV